jgi:hypothetical protein
VLLILGGLAVVGVLIALATGAIGLPGAQDSSTSAQSAVSASEMAANEQWASAACTDILNWKNEIQRDEKGLTLSLGALTRIEDAIARSTRTLSELGKLGLPPALETPQARAEIDQLRSDLESRVQNIEAAASSVANGNLAAIATLIGDLQNDKGLGTQLVTELRRDLPVDLGLSLIETRPCRQLVGIQI